MENKVDESKNPEGKRIKFSDRVKVKATAKAVHMEVGKVYELHPILAEKLVKKGSATYVK